MSRLLYSVVLMSFGMLSLTMLTRLPGSAVLVFSTLVVLPRQGNLVPFPCRESEHISLCLETDYCRFFI